MNKHILLSASAMALSFLAFATPASASGSKISGYCWYHDKNIEFYVSAIIHADSFDKDDWTLEWRRKVVTELGATNYGSNACRAWDGGADGEASALEARAVDIEAKGKELNRIIQVDWVPEDTYVGSRSPTSNRQKSVARDSAPSEKSKPGQPTSPKTASVPTKYIEVPSPNGTIRLSPEVAARNQAAADDYRRKMDEHARAKAEHERKLAKHEQSVAQAAAEKRAHEERLAANAAQVASHQAALFEHRKLAAKPPGVNAVYRGFGGPTCEIARRSAVLGSGTSKDTQFAEVTQDLSGMPRLCIVQGWWWNTSGTGSSRQ